MKIENWIIAAYLLGWIEMLDAYQRAQNVPEKQRFAKKLFVTTHAMNRTLPSEDPAEVNAFIKEMGELKPEEFLIEIMQKKVNRDKMLEFVKSNQINIPGSFKLGI